MWKTILCSSWLELPLDASLIRNEYPKHNQYYPRKGFYGEIMKLSALLLLNMQHYLYILIRLKLSLKLLF